MKKKVVFLWLIFVLGGTLLVPYVASETFEPLRFTLVDIVEDLTTNSTNITGNQTYLSHPEFNNCQAVGTIGNKAYCNNNISGNISVNITDTNCSTTGSCSNILYKNYNQTGSLHLYNDTLLAPIIDADMGGIGFEFKNYYGYPGFFSKGSSMYFANQLLGFPQAYIFLNNYDLYAIGIASITLQSPSTSTTGNFTVGDKIRSKDWSNVTINMSQIEDFNLGEYINDYAMESFERGTLGSNQFMALGNGAQPRGFPAIYPGNITGLAVVCASVGTSADVEAFINNSGTGLKVGIAGVNVANSTMLSPADWIEFTKDSQVGIRTNTVNGTYSTCVGTIYIKYKNNGTGVESELMQTWKDQTANRSLDTYYYNAGNRPLIVRVTATTIFGELDDGGYIEGYSNNTYVQGAGSYYTMSIYNDINIAFRVSPNTSYWVNSTIYGGGSLDMSVWVEDYT